MSAAIAMHASRWTCVISYVGGDQRTKEGVGIVKSGHEKVHTTVNPWDVLGYQAVNDFIVLFDRYAFAAAGDVAAKAKQQVSASDRKREFAVLEQLARAFDAWDRFDHASSLAALDNVKKSANDLRAALGSAKGQRVLDGVEAIAGHLEVLCREQPPSQPHVLDLLTNAKRRKEEGRHDDAVARLYRAIEAIAQVALKEGHGIASTEKVPLARLPETLRSEWASRAEDGVVEIGLQNAYALLASLNDSLGQQFRQAELAGAKSPLTVRNRSILAHGFDRVPENIFDKLWRAALSLIRLGEDDLPRFPRLGQR